MLHNTVIPDLFPSLIYDDLRLLYSVSGHGIYHRFGGSGGSHGGLGGRGGCGAGYLSCLLPRNMPYGNTFRPTEFGSGGSGTSGGTGENDVQGVKNFFQVCGYASLGYFDRLVFKVEAKLVV